MTSDTKQNVQVLDNLPPQMLSYDAGFALDIGGSAAKLIYRDKQNPSTILITVFHRDDIDNYVQYIKDNADIKPGSKKCWLTGVGVKKYGPLLEEKLGIEVVLVAEFNCANKAFLHYSTNLKLEEFFCKLPKKSFKAAYELAMAWFKGFSQFMETPEFAKMDQTEKDKAMMELPPALPSCDVMYDNYDKDEELYPCILVTCGSGFALQTLNEDGKMDMLDYSDRGGRYFLSLGNLLTGAKTYEELTDLASRGDPKKCHTLVQDLHEGGAMDFYSMMPREMPTFAFGKAMSADRENFSKEDIAATLLDVVCGDLCQFVTILAALKKIPRIYFIGSFLNHDIVKETLTARFITRGLMYANEMQLTMRIIPLGAYFTTIGAWIHGHEETQKDIKQ